MAEPSGNPAYDTFREAAQQAVQAAAAEADRAQAQAAAFLEDAAGQVTVGQPVER